jgi:general secretion pathway protein G
MNTPRIGSRIGRNFSGFTLIELLLVMVILVVLSSVVVPMFTRRGTDAKNAAAKTDIHTFEAALQAFEVDCGRFPTNEEGLAALVVAPKDAGGWKGPYVKLVPNDPWGNPYVYIAPGTHLPDSFDLYCLGEDKREGNDDVVNWQ